MNTSIHYPALLALTLVAFFGSVPNSSAALTIFQVTGTVTNEFGTGGQFSFGDLMTATFSFEDTAPRTGGVSNFSTFAAATTTFTMTLPGYLITDPNPLTSTANLTMSDTLEVNAAAGTGPPLLNGGLMTGAGLTWEDGANSLFPTNPPPLVRPDHPAFNSSGSFTVTWEDPGTMDLYLVSGTFDKVDIIPEPSRALLTLLGLGAVLVRRRRR